MQSGGPIRYTVICKKPHHVSSHYVWFFLEFIEGVTKDAIFTELILCIDYSSREKVQIASTFYEFNRELWVVKYFFQRVNRNSD